MKKLKEKAANTDIINDYIREPAEVEQPMDQEKRKIIVAEIEQWRRSKLLPEHYCDFLLNLYMDERQEKPKTLLGVSSSSVSNSNPKAWIAIFGIIGIISFLALHFTSFAFWMQIGVAAGLISILFMLGAAQRSKRPVLSCMCFGVGSVLLLLSGLYLLNEREMTGTPLIFFVALSSMVWITTGIAARFPVFHLAGWLVLFLIYAVVLRHNIGDIDWIGLELSWVPISLVLMWLGWLFHHRSKQIAAVLLAAGVIGWFGAEIYGLALTELNPGLLQLLLGGKLAVCCGFLFGLRKKWIEWVM
ncbi:MAG: hypothetical protein K0R57_5994 [Paenibacillaceae bacterium]|jgi:hypothetical protein|nr:hypothetical protein [Paenibacillaceae bacterium]